MTINPDGDSHGKPVASLIPPQRNGTELTMLPPAQPPAPTPHDDHTVPAPESKLYELFERDDVPFEINGRLLGYSSSRWEDHSHAPYFIDRGELTRQFVDNQSHLVALRVRFEQGSLPERVYLSSKADLERYQRFFMDDFTGYPENVRRYAGMGDRCSACRWFELRIFAVDGEYSDVCSCGVPDADQETEHENNCGLGPARSRYLVLTYGRTEVPGEMNKRRAVWTDSPYEVLSLLTQRHRGNDSGSRAPFLPATSDRALAQAAAHDPGIEKAYVSRKIR